MDDLSWQEKALCRNYDREIFFKDAGRKPKKAKSVCRRCPVTNECLRYALSWPVTKLHGIWGGTTQRQREKILRGKMKIYDEVSVGEILEKKHEVDKSIAYELARKGYDWVDHGQTAQEIAKQIHGSLDHE